MRKIRLSKRAAKRDAVALWTWLVENPGKIKEDAPHSIYKRVAKDWASCPLCTLYASASCKGCPLFFAGMRCIDLDSPFRVWIINTFTQFAGDKISARDAAQKILNVIKAWEV